MTKTQRTKEETKALEDLISIPNNLAALHFNDFWASAVSSETVAPRGDNAADRDAIKLKRDDVAAAFQEIAIAAFTQGLTFMLPAATGQVEIHGNLPSALGELLNDDVLAKSARDLNRPSSEKRGN